MIELSDAVQRTTDAVARIAKQIETTNESVDKIGNAASLIADIASPVSYTHLDVYKRQALGCAKRAVFFSIFRKVIIVVPLTIILPMLGLGVEGVFIAEPVSNAIGGLASFTTMYFTLYKKLPE